MRNKIFIQRYLSPCGEMVLGSFGEKLCLCNWAVEKHPRRVDRSVGTDFQKSVWRRLLEIPYGQTVSYGAMAAKLGMPHAVRAVANANGANAVSLFAPCHRVIGNDGSLTGYGGGLEAKKFLLDLERERMRE